MTRYCTLAFAKAEQDVSKTSKTLDDTQIFGYIAAVSMRIDALLQPNKKLSQRPFFAPYIESRVVQIRSFLVNTPNNTLDMNMYLLELTTVLAGTEDVTSKVSGYVSGYPPYDKLQITTDSDTWYGLECSPVIRRVYPNPLTVTGQWGWHGDWSNAFTATSLLAAAIVTTTAVTFTVTAGQGVLFSPGHMLKIDTEYMEVTSVSTDTLTVTRGVNGSTAATHLIAAPVSILQIPDDIQRVVARQADTLYSRRGSHSVQMLTQVGIVQYPQDLVQELLNTVDSYRM